MAVAGTAAFCLGGIALNRGEHISSLWLVLAAASSYALGYRFYAKFIAARVMLRTVQQVGPALLLGEGLHFERPEKQMLPCTRFTDVAGPGLAGKTVPFW